MDEEYVFLTSSLPDDMNLRGTQFEQFWAMHPETFQSVRMRSGWVRLPRWQQAFGKDYQFSGQTAVAREIGVDVAPYLEWARDVVDPRLNGLLVNWYDGALGHYIGRHRDSEKGLLAGVPIVTISLGEERLMRFRSSRGKGKERYDHPVSPGAVVVVPLETNREWSHEVPKFKRWTGRRISISLRGFRTD